MIGRRSVVVALAFLDRERSIGADGWRRDLLIERIREHNAIEAVRGNLFTMNKSTISRDLNEFYHDDKTKPAKTASNPYRDNRIAEDIQRALRALERGDLDDAERHCEQAERYVVREQAFRLQRGFFENRRFPQRGSDTDPRIERDSGSAKDPLRDNGFFENPMIEAAP